MVEFAKISIKMKNCKTFYEAQTASCPQGNHPASPNQVKILLRLWNKNFVTEIYRNIQTFAFNVLQECSSWASRNDAVQIFKVKGFWLRCESILFSMSSDLRFLK